MGYDLIRDLLGMAKISRQGQTYSVHPQRVYASPNWSDLRTFEFNMLLTADTAANFNNMHLCIPLQIKKKTNAANDIDDGQFNDSIHGCDLRIYQQTTLLAYIDILRRC